ncbi:hypothetical protein BFJ66_g17031 [Fusarium oxysporum f. sp. cepae]|nr:hypothetical protein BFJ66_g17031 [Fusarium oxysporum f. sp. cepae]
MLVHIDWYILLLSKSQMAASDSNGLASGPSAVRLIVRRAFTGQRSDNASSPSISPQNAPLIASRFLAAGPWTNRRVAPEPVFSFLWP